MSLFSLDGKVAVITGSSRGIGKAIAERMAEHGARVVISSRKAEPCQQVADAINAKHGAGRAISIPANISRKEELKHLVDSATKQLGRIDVLVCNAASNPYYGPQAGIEDDQFRKILENNVIANHWLINFTVPQMIERRDGSIIIVSSIGGLRGSPVIGAYCISKAADFQLARNLAVEYGPHNVRVNCIAPGLIKTDFAKALWEDPEALKKRTDTTPLQAHRRARRDRRRRGVPRRTGLGVHDRAEHRHRRRRDHLIRTRAARVYPPIERPAMSSTSYEIRGANALIRLDHPPVNGLGAALRQGLMQALDRALADAQVQAIVVTGSERAFSGGADVKEFGTPNSAREPRLPALIAAFENSPKPVIAAIAGVCMGGGLELALGAHYRVAKGDAQIALPEVKLGLLPGAGGTQRLPRAIGLEAALNMIVSGATVPAAKLKGTALFDDVVDGDPVAAALALADKVVADKLPLKRVRDLKVKDPQAEAFLQFARNTVGARRRTSRRR